MAACKGYVLDQPRVERGLPSDECHAPTAASGSLELPGDRNARARQTFLRAKHAFIVASERKDDGRSLVHRSTAPEKGQALSQREEPRNGLTVCFAFTQ